MTMPVATERQCKINDSYPTSTLLALTKQLYGQNTLSLQQKLTTIYRPIYAPFSALLTATPVRSRVLDIGCGTGTFLLLACRLRRLEIGYGFDCNRASLDVARTANPFPNLCFIDDENALACVVPEVTLLTCIDLLHHIPASGRMAFLDRLLEPMRHGQQVLIKDLDPAPRWKALANDVTDYLSTRSVVSYIGMTDLVQHLEARGFSVDLAVRLDKHIWSHYLVGAIKR